MSITAAEMKERLRAKYSAGEYVLLTEVPNATGGGKERICDAMAFGCWRKTGFHVHGFEIKVSRTDWLKELQDRSKSAIFERHCHFWWIVASKGIVKKEELPASWGLLETRGEGLTVTSAAELRTAEQMPFDMLSAIVRKAHTKGPTDAALRLARQQGYDAGVRAAKLSHGAESFEKEYERLKTTVDQFTAASGVNINFWQAGDIGEAVRSVLNLSQMAGKRSDVGNVKASLRRMLDQIDEFEQSIAKITSQQSDKAADH